MKTQSATTPRHPAQPARRPGAQTPAKAKPQKTPPAADDDDDTLTPGHALPVQVGTSEDRLPLPHERDQGHAQVSTETDPVIEQAHEDLRSGQVDTDMRATPGLDAEQRERLVGTPGKSADARDAAGAGARAGKASDVGTGPRKAAPQDDTRGAARGRR